MSRSSRSRYSTGLTRCPDGRAHPPLVDHPIRAVAHPGSMAGPLVALQDGTPDDLLPGDTLAGRQDRQGVLQFLVGAHRQGHVNDDTGPIPRTSHRRTINDHRFCRPPYGPTGRRMGRVAAAWRAPPGSTVRPAPPGPPRRNAASGRPGVRRLVNKPRQGTLRPARQYAPLRQGPCRTSASRPASS